MITLDSVRYVYPEADTYVLYDLSLHVDRGTLCGIVGASGVGKTTLAKTIAGFIPDTEGGTLTGTVTVDGTDLSTVPLADTIEHVGLVSQNPFNQISGAKYTVRDELAFGLENLGVERADMVERIEQTSTLLRIGQLLERSPYELSGGQQQLVAIASILVMRPAVLVMDEPTSQLDPGGTRLVFEILGSLRASGTTVVLFEHKLEQLREHADVACVLAGGAIQLSGAPRDVLSDPRLAEWGIGSTRYTRAARAITPPVRAGAAPVSLPDAVDYFGSTP